MTDTVGLDIGGTKVLGVRLGPDGEIRAEERRDTPTAGEDLVAELSEMVEALDDGSVGGVGAGAAGMIARDGSVAYGPNVPAFREGLALRERLETAVGLPVVVDNDANTAAWGEFVYGAAADDDDALVITLGTGIGGGVIAQGELIRGAHGFAAEIGHFQVVADGPRCACGEVGHWEAVASGPALERMARERLGVSGEEAGRRATEGDAEAQAVVGDFAEWVAIGLAGLVNIFDPGVIVVGGGLVELDDVLLDPVRRSMASRVEAPGARPEVPIVPATLGVHAGAVGAATMARRRIEGRGDG